MSLIGLYNGDNCVLCEVQNEAEERGDDLKMTSETDCLHCKLGA
jgi:hypothetical protein